MKKNDSSHRLFLLAIEGTEIMHNFKYLTNNGKFEVLLFNTEIVLDTYRCNKPNSSGQVQKEYFEYFEEYIIRNRIDRELEDLQRFINNRFIFYADELNKIFTPTYIPGKIYNAFFEGTLCLTPEFNFDVPNMILFSIPLKRMAKFVNDGVNFICKDE
jgi:hypothetical protein